MRKQDKTLVVALVVLLAIGVAADAVINAGRASGSSTVVAIGTAVAACTVVATALIAAFRL